MLLLLLLPPSCTPLHHTLSALPQTMAGSRTFPPGLAALATGVVAGTGAGASEASVESGGSITSRGVTKPSYGVAGTWTTLTIATGASYCSGFATFPRPAISQQRPDQPESRCDFPGVLKQSRYRTSHNTPELSRHRSLGREGMAVGTLMQALSVLVVVCTRSSTVAATESTLTRQTLIEAYDAMGGTRWRTATGWRSTI